MKPECQKIVKFIHHYDPNFMVSLQEPSYLNSNKISDKS